MGWISMGRIKDNKPAAGKVKKGQFFFHQKLIFRQKFILAYKSI
jgi:hypothetical protein